LKLLIFHAIRDILHKQSGREIVSGSFNTQTGRCQ